MENNETNVPRIIAMANMKGGVGKTTSTICTAIALNKLGRKVEVRDIDPQGSATLWAAKARAAGGPLPFDVRVANRFTVPCRRPTRRHGCSSTRRPASRT